MTNRHCAAQPRVALALMETRVDLMLGGSGGAQLGRLMSSAWDLCLASPSEASAGVSVQAFLDEDETAVARARELGAIASSDEALLMQWLASRLTLAAIDARIGELWMLHACAVADPTTGATVVLVGPSGAGKTTAAATLGRHLGYVTDETAAIRGDGTVVPYPKPLSVLSDGIGPKCQRSPTELGLVRAPEKPWLAAIALLDRTGVDRPSVEPVRTVEALPALAAQTSALQRLDKPLHLVAGHLRRTGGLRRIVYRESDDLAPAVAGLIAGAA